MIAIPIEQVVWWTQCSGELPSSNWRNNVKFVVLCKSSCSLVMVAPSRNKLILQAKGFSCSLKEKLFFPREQLYLCSHFHYFIWALIFVLIFNFFRLPWLGAVNQLLGCLKVSGRWFKSQAEHNFGRNAELRWFVQPNSLFHMTA